MSPCCCPPGAGPGASGLCCHSLDGWLASSQPAGRQKEENTFSFHAFSSPDSHGLEIKLLTVNASVSQSAPPSPPHNSPLKPHPVRYLAFIKSPEADRRTTTECNRKSNQQEVSAEFAAPTISGVEEDSHSYLLTNARGSGISQ